MIDESQLSAVERATVYGRDGEKIGKVGQVYLDDETGSPEWVSVNTGLFGLNESLVPLRDATFAEDRLEVAYDKETVKGAPRVEADRHLDAGEEEELYRYYGLAYTSADDYSAASGTRVGDIGTGAAVAGAGVAGAGTGVAGAGTGVAGAGSAGAGDTGDAGAGMTGASPGDVGPGGAGTGTASAAPTVAVDADTNRTDAGTGYVAADGGTRNSYLAGEGTYDTTPTTDQTDELTVRTDDSADSPVSRGTSDFAAPTGAVDDIVPSRGRLRPYASGQQE